MKKLFLTLAFACCAFAQTASFPGAVATDGTLMKAVNNLSTTLTSTITSTGTTLTVASTGGFVSNMLITFGDTGEIAVVCAVPNSVTLTLGFNGTCPSTAGRGFDNTLAAAHASAVTIYGYYTAYTRNIDRVEIEAIESALGVNLTGLPVVASGTDPSGSCSVVYLEWVQNTQNLWRCLSGTWTKFASGVPSVAGTANQVTVTGSPGATTISLPSTLIPPGSVAAVGVVSGSNINSGFVGPSGTALTSGTTLGASLTGNLPNPTLTDFPTPKNGPSCAVTGNGSTVDTTAFNNCLSANPTAHIIVPAGTYLLNNASGVAGINGGSFSGTLEGMPGAIFKCNSMTNTAGDCIYFNGGTGLVLKNIHMTFTTTTPQARTSASGLGLHLQNQTNAKVEGFVADASSGVCFTLETSTNTQITNMNVNNCSANGTFFKSDNITTLSGLVSNVTFDNPLEITCYTATPTWKGGFTGDNIQVSNSTANGIAVPGCSNVQITNFNVGPTCGDGVIVFQDTFFNTASPSNVKISHGYVTGAGSYTNVISSCTATGNGVETNTAGDVYYDDIAVTASTNYAFYANAVSTLTYAHTRAFGSNAAGYNALNSNIVNVTDALLSGGTGEFYVSGAGGSGAGGVYINGLTVIDVNPSNGLHRAVDLENNSWVVGNNINIEDDQATPTGYIFLGVSSTNTSPISNLHYNVPHGTGTTMVDSTFTVGGSGLGTVTSVATSCGVGGGPITASGTLTENHPTNYFSGSYTIAASDCGKLLIASSATPEAVSLPQGTGSFASPFVFDMYNIGPGAVTITPTTSTINSRSSCILRQGASVRVTTDLSGNYVLEGQACNAQPQPISLTFANSGTVARIGAACGAAPDNCVASTGTNLVYLASPVTVTITGSHSGTIYYDLNLQGTLEVIAGGASLVTGDLTCAGGSITCNVISGTNYNVGTTPLGSTTVTTGAISFTNQTPVNSGGGYFYGTTGTITGTSLSATCDSGTVGVSGAVVGQVVMVSSTTGADVGGAFTLRGSVTSANTVTVYVCGTGTPASLAYNVRVLP